MAKVWSVIAVVLILGVTAGTVMAAPETQPAGDTDSDVLVAAHWAKALATVGACIGAAIAAMGGGLGVGKIGASCIESIARQPEAARDMFAPMVVAAGMVEVGMLFAIVVCLMGILG